MLHSKGQLRSDRDGNTEKGCQKFTVQQKTNHAKNYQETTVKGPQKNQFPIAVLELTASLCINHYTVRHSLHLVTVLLLL